jgi:hypothetical protein
MVCFGSSTAGIKNESNNRNEQGTAIKIIASLLFAFLCGEINEKKKKANKERIHKDAFHDENKNRKLKAGRFYLMK